LTRNFDPESAETGAAKESMIHLLKSKNFGELRMNVEMGNFSMAPGRNGQMEFHRTPAFHSVGHGGIGGEMQDPFTSTNDPLFFMHHSGIDRLWAIWQEEDLKNRLVDVTSPSARPTFPGFRGAPPIPDLTLKTPIELGFAAPDRPVGDVMDIMNRDGKGFLCYRYDRGANVYL